MKRKINFSLFFILSCGLLFRLYRLGIHELWYDEARSYSIASFIKGFWIIRRYDTQPPFYYLLLHFWMKIVPDTEFWLRVPSLLFAVLTILAIYKLCNLFFTHRTAILASFIIAISPIHIWYAQELRPYSLTPFFIVLITYFFTKALEEDKTRHWIGLLLTTFLGILTSYFVGIFIIGELFVLSLARYRKYFTKWLKLHLIFGLASFIIFFPFVISFFLQAITLWKEGFWIQRPVPNSLFITFNNFNVGYTATKTITILSSFIYMVVFIHGLFYGYKKFRGKSIILFSLLMTPILFTYLFSFLIPIYIDRQLIAFSPLYYIFIALSLQGLGFKFLKPVVFFCIFLFSGLSLNNYYRDILILPFSYHQGVYIKKPFKPLFQYIVNNFNPEECVIAYTNPGIDSVLRYYNSKSKNPLSAKKMPPVHYFYISKAQDDYWETIFKRKDHDKYALNLEAINIDKFRDKKILIVSGSWSRDGTMDENSKAVNQWMERRFKKISEKEFDGIFVSVYE